MMMLRIPVSQFCKTALVQRTASRGFHGSVALNLAKGDKVIKLLPTQVVIAAYTKLDAADDAASALKQAMRDREVSYKNVAVIRKNDEGNLKITESGKIKKRHGAAVGALVAGTSVLLMGPIVVGAGALGGALAGAAASVGARVGAAYGATAALQGTMLAHISATAAGAVTGGYAASKIETLNPDKLNSLGNILQPDQSALIAVFDQIVVPMEKLDAEEQASRDEILSQVGKDIGNALQQGEDVAYMVAATDDEGIVVTRMATGADAADIKAIVIKGDAVEEGDDSEPEETITYEVIDGKVVDEEANKKQ